MNKLEKIKKYKQAAASMEKLIDLEIQKLELLRKMRTGLLQESEQLSRR